MKFPRRRRSLLAMLAVALVALLVWRRQQPQAIGQRLAKLRAVGLPTTLTELDTWYSAVPDKENGALLLIEAASSFRAGGETNLPIVGYAKEPPRGQPWPPELLVAAQAHLASNQEGFNKLHAALGHPRSRYPTNPNLGMDPTVPLFPLQKANSELALHAQIAAETGHSAEAMQCLLDQVRLIRTMDGCPLLTSHLVQMAHEPIATGSAEGVFSRCAFSEAELSSLQHAYAEAADSLSYENAIIGEICWDVDVLSRPAGELADLWPGTTGDTWQDPMRKAGASLYGFSGMQRRDLRIAIDYLDDLRVTAKLPPRQRLLAANRLNAKLNERLARQFVPFARSLLPTIGKVVSIDAHRYAILRCTESACAIERWRLAHGGSLPPSLGTLVPEYLAAVPEDPMDGKPLKFRPLAQGYVVYSIGEDGTDDGGKERMGGQPTGWDYTFTVAR